MIEKQNTFTNIRAWMSNDKNIKKNELVIFAYIHGWSYQKKENSDGAIVVTLGCYTGSISNLVEWSKLSRSTVIRSLNSLVEKEYIVKKTYKPFPGKNETRCVYYSSVSRVPGKVEELESLNCSEKTPLDLLCEQINDSFILTPGDSQSDTPHGVQMEPNKLINNLVNNTAAVEADADISNPLVATNPQFFPDKAKAAAVSLNKNIKDLFGTNPFDKNFIPCLSSKIAESEIELSNVGDFLAFVDKRAIEKVQKKGGSHTNLFRYLCLAPDVITDYVMSNPVKKDQNVKILQKECPICKTKMELNSGICQCCEFDFSYSTDLNVVNRELQIFKLDHLEKAQIKKELNNVFVTTGFTLDPVKIQEQKEMIKSVYQRHKINYRESA